MIEVISNGIYPKQCTCEKCHAVLSYYGIDIESETVRRYIPEVDAINLMYQNYIRCPQCGCRIILERSNDNE